ncbi:nitrous oxide reductase family maturation protein NosD [Methylophaga sp. OBS4]|uniref:nitrous oxide reductase family maturation protein NosD n=1 Tax=Methylophaga sp. OBS4 TaxID=2991935 RepID=UPI002257AE8A|nr:nitrous oxide reductase family maturation protein NosD [Methylophaga sp. OBS4]MCX4187933.1 nitrous oxide reductase family maturation protein NosD [Methylophaga sp. OBS4]
MYNLPVVFSNKSVIRKVFFLYLFTVCLSFTAQANSINITPADDLQYYLDQAEAGDHLILNEGSYQGNFVINTPLQLSGKQGALLDSLGQGNTLTINAADVIVNDLQLSNWGHDLTAMNAGIFITREANNTRIINNYLYGDCFGIWVDAAPNVEITNNRIQGNEAIRSPDRGNGIHLFNVSGALVKNNEVWHSRDGIYIDTSNGNQLIGNYLHDLRYGIHYMYSYHNVVAKNHTRHTRTGYALMQSKYLTVTQNVSEQDVNYGILMNFITNSIITGNVVTSVQNLRNPQISHTQQGYQPEGKALFIYNSLFNQIHNNKLADSDIGIHLTAGSEDNTFTGNAFINNSSQVKYVANRSQDWSVDGVGNFWSDYLGWDMNDDAIGDVAYEPNDGIDRLLWKYPAAKLLINSPSVMLLRWVQRQFPVLKSPGVKDSYPLMTLPAGLTP